MTERRPTSSLSAFQGLSDPQTPPRRLDAETLAITSIVLGGGVGSVLAILAFVAGLVVLRTPSVLGVASTTIATTAMLVAATVALGGAIAGVLALWRGHIDGSRVGVRAGMGLTISLILFVLATGTGLG